MKIITVVCMHTEQIRKALYGKRVAFYFNM